MTWTPERVQLATKRIELPPVLPVNYWPHAWACALILLVLNFLYEFLGNEITFLVFLAVSGMTIQFLWQARSLKKTGRKVMGTPLLFFLFLIEFFVVVLFLMNLSLS